MIIEYLLLGLLLGVSPCMLPLFPVTASLLAKDSGSLSNKLFTIGLYLTSSVICTFIISLLVANMPFVITLLQGLSSVILIIAGLIWLDLLMIKPQIQYGGNSGLLMALLMPLFAGGCTIPAYVMVLSFATSPILALTALNIGLNIPLVVYLLLYPLPGIKRLGKLTMYIKYFLGLAVLLVGCYNITSTQTSTESYNVSTFKSTAPITKHNYILVTADWCSACQALKKSLGNLDKLGIKIYDITKITPDKLIFIKQHDAKYIPLFLELDKYGKEIKRIQGNTPDEIREYINGNK